MKEKEYRMTCIGENKKHKLKEVFLTNKNHHNNLIYTMFLFYFFFGYKWKLRHWNGPPFWHVKKFVTMPADLWTKTTSLSMNVTWTNTHLYPLFTGSHYDTWRRILRLSLYWYLRLVTLPGLRLVLFSNSCVGSFTSYKNQIGQKVLWDGTYGFSSLSEKTRKSNRLQMSLQR